MSELQNWYGDVGAGWGNLLVVLNTMFDEVLRENPKGHIKVLQVKEKFGTLRIYYETEGLTLKQDYKVTFCVDYTEELSAYICEVCGKSANITDEFAQGDEDLGRWIKTLCTQHKRKYYQEGEKLTF
jgi:hypothetical protein